MSEVRYEKGLKDYRTKLLARIGFTEELLEIRWDEEVSGVLEGLQVALNILDEVMIESRFECDGRGTVESSKSLIKLIKDE